MRATELQLEHAIACMAIDYWIFDLRCRGDIRWLATHLSPRAYFICSAPLPDVLTLSGPLPQSGSPAREAALPPLFPTWKWAATSGNRSVNRRFMDWRRQSMIYGTRPAHAARNRSLRLSLNFSLTDDIRPLVLNRSPIIFQNLQIKSCRLTTYRHRFARAAWHLLLEQSVELDVRGRASPVKLKEF